MVQETQKHSTANFDVIVERLENLKVDNSQEHSVILEQVKKTNGSVADIQKWRYTANGVLLLLNIIVVPVIIALVIRFIMNEFF